MIDRKTFIQSFTPCDGCKCNGKGWMEKRAITIDDQEEYGVPAGELIKMKCGSFTANLARRKAYDESPWLDDECKWFELEDYTLQGVTQDFKLNITKQSLQTFELLSKNIGTLFKEGGFLVLTGGTNTGKTIFSHILARESMLSGKLVRAASILDLVIELSYLDKGKKAYDGDDRAYDFDEYAAADLLIIDNFDLVNEYFRWADVRRANLVNIFRQRLKNGLPTIIITREDLSHVFSTSQRDIYKFPIDFPLIINKKQTKLEFYGRFNTRKSSKEETVKGEERPVRLKVSKRK